MQLILDTEADIDIPRNMSTIEQESLSEKFSNNIIELPICNKENIQKPGNIIDQSDDTSISLAEKDSDSEINDIEAVLENNGNVEKREACEEELNGIEDVDNGNEIEEKTNETQEIIESIGLNEVDDEEIINTTEEAKCDVAANLGATKNTESQLDITEEKQNEETVPEITEQISFDENEIGELCYEESLSGNETHDTVNGDSPEPSNNTSKDNLKTVNDDTLQKDEINDKHSKDDSKEDLKTDENEDILLVEEITNTLSKDDAEEDLKTGEKDDILLVEEIIDSHSKDDFKEDLKSDQNHESTINKDSPTPLIETCQDSNQDVLRTDADMDAEVDQKACLANERSDSSEKVEILCDDVQTDNNIMSTEICSSLNEDNFKSDDHDVTEIQKTNDSLPMEVLTEEILKITSEKVLETDMETEESEDISSHSIKQTMESVAVDVEMTDEKNIGIQNTVNDDDAEIGKSLEESSNTDRVELIEKEKSVDVHEEHDGELETMDISSESCHEPKKNVTKESNQCDDVIANDVTDVCAKNENSTQQKEKDSILHRNNEIVDINDDDVIDIADEKVLETKDISKPIDNTSESINSATDDSESLSKTDNKTELTNNSVPSPVDVTIDVDEKDLNTHKTETKTLEDENEEPVKSIETQQLEVSETKSDKKLPPIICKLSNTLDILSDEEDEPPAKSQTQPENMTNSVNKQSIDLEDDDDIMLIEDSSNKDSQENRISEKIETNVSTHTSTEEKIELKDTSNESVPEVITPPPESTKPEEQSTESETKIDEKVEKQDETPGTPPSPKPLLPQNFLKTCKKNLADMTRDDLEEFCILKIVESVVDRSNLGEIKAQLKMVKQNMEESEKKAVMLTKQNRDLQVVLKSVQEELKKGAQTITPLKITRSVGMQVLMTDKPGSKRKLSNLANLSTPNNSIANNRTARSSANQTRSLKTPPNNQTIPVPRLIPANNNPAVKSNQMLQQTTPNKSPSNINPVQNGMRNSPLPMATKAEKRPHNRIQSTTVDLTDDEPPAKIITKQNQSVRVVPPQNLLATSRPLAPTMNSPRKVYIPISGPQAQSMRPGQTIMVKTVTQGPPPRVRLPPPPPTLTPKIPPSQNMLRVNRMPSKHPAPLPDAMKQYQPPNWKALPPAPELKLSKVENGIVISWKIDGYQEDNYEQIASYQLYAYQETNSPPSTALWKKIGDVKALPLPMACTLTQFMAGYKYYFAVRAVDVRSRLGPFSAPGNILLLNKM